MHPGALRRLRLFPFVSLSARVFTPLHAPDHHVFRCRVDASLPEPVLHRLYSGRFLATTTHLFSCQGYHIAYIFKESLNSGLTSVEPLAQEAWVDLVRSTAIDISFLQQECPPSYVNNDCDTSKNRWYLGETCGPGWDAFEKIVADWRDEGDLAGLALASVAASRAHDAKIARAGVWIRANCILPRWTRSDILSSFKRRTSSMEVSSGRSFPTERIDQSGPFGYPMPCGCPDRCCPSCLCR